MEFKDIFKSIDFEINMETIMAQGVEVIIYQEPAFDDLKGNTSTPVGIIEDTWFENALLLRLRDRRSWQKLFRKPWAVNSAK